MKGRVLLPFGFSGKSVHIIRLVNIALSSVELYILRSHCAEDFD
jgi:hypothetical protein